MKSRLTAKDVALFIIAVISLTTWHYPVARGAYAQTGGTNEELNFEIKSETQNQAPISQNQNEKVLLAAELKAREIALAKEKFKADRKAELVRQYLQSKRSPFAPHTETLLAQEDWKIILSISNSESNMGLHCYKNNCSGIFGKKGLRTYKTVGEWMVDFQSLIDRRYKNQTLSQMNGVYVYPRSNNWLKASTKVYNDLLKIEQTVDQETQNFSPVQA